MLPLPYWCPSEMCDSRLLLQTRGNLTSVFLNSITRSLSKEVSTVRQDYWPDLIRQQRILVTTHSRQRSYVLSIERPESHMLEKIGRIGINFARFYSPPFVQSFNPTSQRTNQASAFHGRVLEKPDTWGWPIQVAISPEGGLRKISNLKIRIKYTSKFERHFIA